MTEQGKLAQEGISWKKLTQPRGQVKMLVQMENLVQMEKPV